MNHKFNNEDDINAYIKGTLDSSKLMLFEKALEEDDDLKKDILIRKTLDTLDIYEKYKEDIEILDNIRNNVKIDYPDQGIQVLKSILMNKRIDAIPNGLEHIVSG